MVPFLRNWKYFFLCLNQHPYLCDTTACANCWRFSQRFKGLRESCKLFCLMPNGIRVMIGSLVTSRMEFATLFPGSPTGWLQGWQLVWQFFARYKATVWIYFVSSVSLTISIFLFQFQVKENPGPISGGLAPIYGAAGKMPDRGMVQELLVDFMDGTC